MNGITNGVNKVTQSPDLWGNLSGYIHDAEQHLFGDNSIWHGATSNEQNGFKLNFQLKKISMFRGWYGTYMNLTMDHIQFGYMDLTTIVIMIF